jgi:ABC-type polysaccharide/polyol phosphate transport system ATPase subunit
MAPVVSCREVSKAFTLRTRRPLFKDRVLAVVRPQLRETRQVFWALRGVDLAVEPGEALGLIGPNGAGKTTLLRIIAGIFAPTAGTVEVRGRMAPLLALGMGFHDELTGRENIYLASALLGLSTREIRAVEGAIIEFSELGEFIDAPTKTYSAGMHMRLGFSIAAQLLPDIFLLDEILAVGDEHFQGKCLAYLERHRASARTFVVCTHDLGFVESMCDRAALLIGGRLIAVGAPKEIIRRYHDALAGRP